MAGEVPPAGPALTPARFPGRAPIEAYGNGGFRFAGMSHRGSILALPDGIEAWAPRRFDEIDIDSLAAAVRQARDIQVLLIGTGPDLVPLGAGLRAALAGAGLRPETMATGAAVRTYNVLLSEDRAVAAALIAVDDAGRAR